MSADVVALVLDRPEPGSMFEELGAQLGLRVVVGGDEAETTGGTVGGADTGTAETGPIRVYDTGGRLIVVVPEPVLVMVPGEIERLLGTPYNMPPPVWWVEIRAAADLPEAPQLARQGADALVARHGGTVWAVA